MRILIGSVPFVIASILMFATSGISQEDEGSEDELDTLTDSAQSDGSDPVDIEEESGDEVVEPPKEEKKKERRKGKKNRKKWLRTLDFDAFRYSYTKNSSKTANPNGSTNVSRSSTHNYQSIYNSNFVLTLASQDWTLRFGRQFDGTNDSTIGLGMKFGEHEVGLSTTWSSSSSEVEITDIKTKTYTFETGPHYVRRMRLGPNRLEAEAHLGMIYTHTRRTQEGVVTNKSKTSGYYLGLGTRYFMPITLMKMDRIYYAPGINYSYRSMEFANLVDGYDGTTDSIRHLWLIDLLGIRVLF